MKKILVLILVCFIITSCKLTHNTTKTSNVVTFANTITAKELKTLLYDYASDEFEGRLTGEKGQKNAVEYLKNFYIKNGISGGNNGKYFQQVPADFLNKNSYHGTSLKDSENVLAFIKGSEFPDEVLVISAHLDHIGIENGEIYNGADDDGSGTVAILEIAQAFKKAVEKGHKPKRSVLFLHVTGEEKGLLGSKYYTEYPVYPLKNTVADLNIDMIGRIDDIHKKDENYLYLIGSDKLSTDLHNLSEAANTKYTQIKLDYRYNTDNDINRFYYRSDHYNFAKNNIPVIFYFNGTHDDYHRPTDTPDKIMYDLLEKRTRLVFFTAWEIANRLRKLRLD